MSETSKLDELVAQTTAAITQLNAAERTDGLLDLLVRDALTQAKCLGARPRWPIGLNDKHGNPIHVGDTLSFDPVAWGGHGSTEPHVFTVQVLRGSILYSGVASDLQNYCEIIADAPDVPPVEWTPELVEAFNAVETGNLKPDVEVRQREPMFEKWQCPSCGTFEIQEPNRMNNCGWCGTPKPSTAPLVDEGEWFTYPDVRPPYGIRIEVDFSAVVIKAYPRISAGGGVFYEEATSGAQYWCTPVRWRYIADQPKADAPDEHEVNDKMSIFCGCNQCERGKAMLLADATASMSRQRDELRESLESASAQLNQAWTKRDEHKQAVLERDAALAQLDIQVDELAQANAERTAAMGEADKWREAAKAKTDQLRQIAKIAL